MSMYVCMYVFVCKHISIRFVPRMYVLLPGTGGDYPGTAAKTQICYRGWGPGYSTRYASRYACITYD